METKEIATTYKAEVNIYENASALKISDEEQKKLLSDFDGGVIEIRLDGLIYLPQVFWRERLNETFGCGQWALIPKGSTKDPDKDKLYVQGILMIRGNFVAEAVGEAELHSNNPNQSWASVWESAKSDCITRCCKDLGIASLLWQPEFVNKWIKTNAVKVYIKGKDEKIKVAWRKKTAEPFYNETGIVKDNEPQNIIQVKPEKQFTKTKLDFKKIKENLSKLKNRSEVEEYYKNYSQYKDIPELIILFQDRVMEIKGSPKPITKEINIMDALSKLKACKNKSDIDTFFFEYEEYRNHEVFISESNKLFKSWKQQ